MKCFHLPIKKGNVHVNADLVESLIPDDGGTVVRMASGDTFTTSIDIETALKRIANAQPLHLKNGE